MMGVSLYISLSSGWSWIKCQNVWGCQGFLSCEISRLCKQLFVSRKLISLSGISAVNLIEGWCRFARTINSSISFLSVLHNEKISSMYLFRGSVSFSLYHRHKEVGKGDCHLCTHCSSVCLEIVFGVEFKWVLLKNKFKDSSEGLGGDRRIFPVESLVCFAY